jgi:uncharacterized DUF497 family protein
MEFEWNDDKNEANIVKHGFDFQDAWKVLERPPCSVSVFQRQ